MPRIFSVEERQRQEEIALSCLEAAVEVIGENFYTDYRITKVKEVAADYYTWVTNQAKETLGKDK